MSLARNQDRLRRWGFLTDTSAGYGPNTEAAYTKALDALEKFMPLVANPVAAPSLVLANKLALRGLAEVVSHESIILEMYKDSKGIPTWGPGITSASGHGVERYKDNPQPMEKVLAVFWWLVREKYLPAVLKAFEGYPLNEWQIAAALSFHWNTGAIRTASWVKLVKAGEIAAAKKAFMEWKKPAEIIERRTKERDLFFDGKWSGDGKTTVFQVRKPSYAPNWGSAKRINILDDLRKATEGTIA